jgi:hypothetical protein
MKSKELLLGLIVIVIILSVVAHKLTNKKNKLLSFWLGVTLFTIIYVSYMIINKNHVVNYSCSNDYWERKDYKFDAHFLMETYGEYKCGCDVRYNDPNSVVYYNELINILLSTALLFTVGNIPIFKDILVLQAINTITYFATLIDYSFHNPIKNTNYIYLGISSLYFIIPIMLIYQLK